MNCNEASELLAAAVLGDLDRDEQRAVHAHLAGCDDCLEEEHEFFESIRLVRAHIDEQPDPGVHDRVMARAQRVGLMPRLLLTAAATALIVLGLQTAMESWNREPLAITTASAVSRTMLANRPERPTAPLLQGTLFDRQRNVPEKLRRLRNMKRRSDTARPLDL